MFACGLASLVAVFQVSVFSSFLRASSVAIDFVGAEAWVMARGVEAFDFPYPISANYGELVLRCFPGFSVKRIRSGFTTWRSPTGTNGNVALIAYDDAPVSARGFIADRSDASRLELSGRDIAEIGRITARWEASTDRLPTYLGAPYVVTSFRLGSVALPFRGDDVAFLGLFSSERKAVLKSQLECASTIAPDIKTISNSAFKKSSAMYWTLKTGAGAAILLAAALATLLNLTALSHGVNRFISRHRQSLLTLRGHGAPSSFVEIVVWMVASIVAATSAFFALVLLPIAVFLVKPILPWVELSFPDLLILILLSLLGILVGFIISRRQVDNADIGRIFRA